MGYYDPNLKDGGPYCFLLFLYTPQTVCVCVCGVWCVCVCVGGGGAYTVLTLSVHPSVTFWFLLLVLLNSLRNLFMFCINVDIDKMLLLHKNNGQGVNSFRVISFCSS